MMTINPTKFAALVSGVLLALGAAGCASWNANKSGSASNKGYSSTASAEHRTAGQHVSDATITAKVKTAFAVDKTVKARDINVDTREGVVTLNGTVSSSAEKDRAISIARNTSGVVDVKDNLKVSG
jgi:hyperosmotically inducible protein